MARTVVALACIALVSYTWIGMLIVYLRVQDKDVKTAHDEKAAFGINLYYSFIEYNFYFIPFILTILIINLICMLQHKQRKLSGAGFSNVFSRENRNMLIILFVFDLSLIVRIVWNKVYVKNFFNNDICVD